MPKHTTLHVQCTVYLAYNGEHEPGSLVNEGVNVAEQATSHVVSEREGEGGEKGRTGGERRLLGDRGDGLSQSGSETQPGAGSRPLLCATRSKSQNINTHSVLHVQYVHVYTCIIT